jgi:ribose/xylose/arabinose/galactoside ABC-type transport system permease subunit
MMTFLSGMAQLLTKGLPVLLYDSRLYLFLGKGTILGLPCPTVFFIVAAVIMAFLFNRTNLGRKIYYTGANARAAYLCGIRTGRIKVGAFMCTGAFSAIAGIFLCAQTNQAIHSVGNGQEMTGIAVAVLGGTAMGGGRGSVIGTVLGALIFQLLLNILALSGLGTYMELLLRGGLLVVVVIGYQIMNEIKKRSR